MREKVAEVMKLLCSIPSPSGSEGRLMSTVAEFLEKRGVEVRSFPGGLLVNPEAELLVCTHLDTATPAKCSVAGEWAAGGGACDAKASLCALLMALSGVEELRIGGAMVVQEESTGYGSAALAEALEPRLCLVMEPTSLRIATRIHGTLEVEFAVAGRSAHAAVPHAGVNAVLRSFSLLRELERLPARVSVLGIRAGGSLYAVPEECRLKVDLLFPPEVNGSELKEELRKLARRYGSLRVIDEAPGAVFGGRCTELLERAVAGAGLEAERCSMPSWCDAVNLHLAGWDVAVFGPGELARCHTREERVRLGEIAAAAEVLMRLNSMF